MARNNDEDDDDDRDDDDGDESDDGKDEDRPRKKKKKGLTNEEKQMAMFAHLSMLLVGFVGPLIIWMMKKDESRFVERHAKEALNFSITMSIAAVVGLFLTCGILTIIASIYSLIACIQAGMAANRGENYTYQMGFRMIK